MRPSARKLAAALASRLDAVVPRPLRVTAEGTVVTLHDGAEAWSGEGASIIVEEEDDRSLDERLRCASDAVISGVQDCVARALRAEWPRLSGGGMAMPDARTDGQRVYLWFGPDEQGAVLTLPPIALDELMAD